MGMFTDDPNELNKRYMPKDDGIHKDMYEDYEDEDEGEEIPEEELTEEEREMINTLESWPEETWRQIFEGLMDEEDYTLSDEEFGAKNILAKLNTTNPSIDYGFKLAILKLVTPTFLLCSIRLRIRWLGNYGISLVHRNLCVR